MRTGASGFATPPDAARRLPCVRLYACAVGPSVPPRAVVAAAQGRAARARCPCPPKSPSHTRMSAPVHLHSPTPIVFPCAGRLWGDPALLPRPGYLARCIEAAHSMSACAENFLDSSYLADGTTPIRAYLARSSGL